jgi:DNA-binding CsgD family transcriptional regulator
MYAAFTAGQLPGGEVLEQVATAIVAMSSDPSSREDLLLEGVARVYTDGFASGVPLLQRAIAAYRSGPLLPTDIAWLPLACRMAHNTWDFESWAVLSAALVDQARESGALSVLPAALLLDISVRAQAGDLATAQALVDEAATIGDVIGSTFFGHYGALVVAGYRAREAEVGPAIRTITNDPHLSSEGKALTATEWAAAVVANGLGRHEEAYAAAMRGAAHPQELGLATWSMVELVEAAARLHRTEDDAVVAAARRIQEMTTACGTDWALGTASYVSALMTDGPDAERQYREAIDRLERSGVRILAARAELVYGEWLLAQGRREDGHRHLVAAEQLLTDLGVDAFAERARAGLVDAGAARTTPRRRPTAGPTPLTPQESQIARLAADGLTNPQIGAQLYISAHTVEWHLRKVFAKLDIHSRKEIGAVLARRASAS